MSREPLLIIFLPIAAILAAVLIFAHLDATTQAALVGGLIAIGTGLARSQVTPTAGALRAPSVPPLAVLALLVALGGCTPAAVSTGVGVATAIVDIGGAVCEELPPTEPAWVSFACAIVDPSGVKPPQRFTARIPTSSAPALAELRARRCSTAPPGRVAP